MIEIPRWVHREGSSQFVETLDGLREAEADGWRVNPNEPDVCYAEPIDEAAEKALLVELAETLKAETSAETAHEAAQDDAGDVGSAAEGEEAASVETAAETSDDQPKRKAAKKR